MQLGFYQIIKNRKINIKKNASLKTGHFLYTIFYCWHENSFPYYETLLFNFLNL